VTNETDDRLMLPLYKALMGHKERAKLFFSCTRVIKAVKCFPTLRGGSSSLCCRLIKLNYRGLRRST